MGLLSLINALLQIKSEPGSSTSSVTSEKKLQPIQPESSSTGAGNNDISAVSSSVTPSLPSISSSTPAMPSIPSPAAALGSSAAQLNFQAILSQMQQAAAAAASISPNPFQFMDPTALMTGMSMPVCVSKFSQFQVAFHSSPHRTVHPLLSPADVRIALDSPISSYEPSNNSSRNKPIRRTMTWKC